MRRRRPCRAISIHAPRVGSDQTPGSPPRGLADFNPRSPCGERRERDSSRGCDLNISIHAPRVGSDPAPACPACPGADFNPRSPCGERLQWFTLALMDRNFNPRPPCGERRRLRAYGGGGFQISIHAPRVGSDPDRTRLRRGRYQISIHAPRVGSDPPGGGIQLRQGISIHAPRVGSDPSEPSF